MVVVMVIVVMVAVLLVPVLVGLELLRVVVPVVVVAVVAVAVVVVVVRPRHREHRALAPALRGCRVQLQQGVLEPPDFAAPLAPGPAARAQPARGP